MHSEIQTKPCLCVLFMSHDTNGNGSFKKFSGRSIGEWQTERLDVTGEW